MAAGDEAALSLGVPDMDCPSCANKVGSALDRAGVASYNLRPTSGTVVVEDLGEVDRDAVVAAVESAGYDVAGLDGEDGAPAPTVVWRSTRAKATAGSAVLLLAGLVLEFVLVGLDGTVLATGGVELSVADALLLAAAAGCGQVILRNGYYSARTLSLDIDLLMSVAIVAAVVVSPFAPKNLYVEAASLAVLFNVAELLERYSVDRARGSLRELMALSPDTATVRRDGETVTVPVEEVAVGETVLVEPGEKLPVDGVVRDGGSAVDESPITGESVPVDKAVGDEVFAGTINQQGYVEVESTAEAEATTLARIVEKVEDAEASPTERERFVDRFAGYYTPVVVAAAVLSATVPPLVFGAPWVPWFLNGIAFLVIACPCAFVISTPVTVVSAVTSAARNGVLVKGGDRLEAMGEVDAVALDKTGTLTRGELRLTDVLALGVDRETLLARTAAVESRSEHPIADAVTAAAESDGIVVPEVSAFESLTGKGVRGTVDGEELYAGTPELFAELGHDLGHVHARPDGGQHLDADEGIVEPADGEGCEREDCLDLLGGTVAELERQGKTVVLVGTERELFGVVAVADEVRPEAADAVARLADLGVAHVAMLTGDNEGTARAIARQVGVDDHRAELLPDEKVAAVERLQAEYGTVAMVGDGINDAPALATADVGVAMGAAGTDTAIETADVALLGDDLAKLPYLVELSDRAVSVIRQNVWGSLGVKAALAVGIPLGLVSVVVAVVAGDVGMTVVVTANALRLSRVEP
jgi:Cd2+/Zn2+-exporting ATPase